MTASPEQGADQKPDPLQPQSVYAAALQLLGAVAGLAAFVTVVGGALLWLRFDYASLPADQAVASLPESMLVLVGIHALAIPVLLGLLWAALFAGVGVVDEGSWHTEFFVAPLLLALGVAVGIELGDWEPLLWWLVAGMTAFGVAWMLLLRWRARERAKREYVPQAMVSSEQRRRRLGFIVALAVLAALGGLAMSLGTRHLDLWLAVALGALTAAGLIAIVQVARRTQTRRHTSWVVFTACVVCGAALALARVVDKPQLEPMALLLKDGTTLSGFHVGHTADRYYVAPLPDPAFATDEVNSVLEVDRADVRRVVIRKPEGTRAEESGRSRALALARQLAPPPALADEELTVPDPVKAFAPLVHLHFEERWLPMSAEDFVANSALLFAHVDADCDFEVASGQHRKRGAASTRLGGFDAGALGHEPGYVHRGSSENGCDDGEREFSTLDHTRPYDTRDRPSGLKREEGFYLDLADRERRGQAQPKPAQGAARTLPATPVYWEQEDLGAGALRITYWFFYGYSVPQTPADQGERLAHEGDWERISVVIQAGSGPDRWRPLRVRYHFHNEQREYPWSAIERERADTGGAGPKGVATHPVVYSAVGSHASYWKSDRFEQTLRFEDRDVLAVRDDATSCPQCPQWRTWERLVEARSTPWYGFGGAWGAVGRAPAAGDRTGPLGPSSFKLGVGVDPAAAAIEPGRPVAE